MDIFLLEISLCVGKIEGGEGREMREGGKREGERERQEEEEEDGKDNDNDRDRI